MAPM